MAVILIVAGFVSSPRAQLTDYEFTVGKTPMYSMSGAKQIWANSGSGSRWNYVNPWWYGTAEPYDFNSGAISLPFTFKFDNVDYKEVVVYMSGAMSFGSDVMKASYDNNLAGAYMPLLAPFWDDLHITGNGPGCWNPMVSFTTIGNAPNRVFVVEWRDMEVNYHYTWVYGYRVALGNRATFQLQLHENGKIVFSYGKMQYRPDCGNMTWIPDNGYIDQYEVTGSVGMANGKGEFISISPYGSSADASYNGWSNDYVDLYKYPIDQGISFEFLAPNVQLSSSEKQTFFGTVSFGSSVDMNVTVVNVGTSYSKPLTINSMTIGGPQGSMWSQVSPLPGPLFPGEKANVTFRYTPTTNGPHVASLTITSNGRDSGTQQLMFTGVCVAPEIEIVPLGLNTPTKMFRKTRVVVGDSLKERFLAKNIGDGSLIISALSNITGDDASMFKITRIPAVGIAKDNVDTVEIGFYPRREGGINARLEVRSNAANGSQYIDFAGVGIIPRLQIMQGEFIAIDSIPIEVRTCHNIELYNPGSAPLVLTRNYLASADGDFEYTPLTGNDTIIAPNETKTVQICITGLQKGTRRARLRFMTNIPLTYPDFGPRIDTSAKNIEIWAGVIPVDLSKVAIAPIIDGVVNEPVVTTVTINNAGSETAVYSQPQFVGADKDIFSITKGSFPVTIERGGKYEFEITAMPTRRGMHDAEMVIDWKTEDRLYTYRGGISFESLIACSQADAAKEFGSVKIGSETVKQIEVSNCGEVQQAYAASITGNGYRLISDAVTDPIAPGQKAVFTVAFAPTTEGSSTGSLVIKSKHISDMNVNLAGEGEKPTVSSVSGDVNQDGFVLSQNTPNPSVGMTTVKFRLPKQSHAVLTLTDLNGKVVKELAAGIYNSGEYSVNINSTELASGTYFYTLEASGVRLVRQMVIRK
jgi:hypothetical protein